MQFGSGEFKNMNLARCVNGGFLIQALSLIKNCTIENCTTGVKICRNVNGDVVLDENQFKRCKMNYSSFAQSVKVDGKYQLATAYPLDWSLGKRYHEDVLKYRKFISDRKKGQLGFFVLPLFFSCHYSKL